MMDVADEQELALPQGFAWGAVRAGIKASGNPDLAAVNAPAGASAAVMFTTNLMAAAPVTIGRQHLLSNGGRLRVVLVNAGNANCATGQQGLEDCTATCVAAAEAFGCIFDEVLPSSTGIIGVPLPVEKVLAALPELKSAMGGTAEHADAFANAIMTTDTRRKVARAVIDVDGKQVRLFGAAKGAGMIHPQLGPPVARHATMLVYLFTDLEATAEDLRSLLASTVDSTFNCISIDGDTSTNDTVVLMASGSSGVVLDDNVHDSFLHALALVCSSLAHQIVDDGEGVTHVVSLHVTGAETESEARRVAKAIAHSPLCKTAWSSADPNWGRVIAAAGYSGVAVQPEKMTMEIGGLPVFERGMRSAAFDEAATHAAMLEREYTIHLDLGMGRAECRFLTCDLTEEYVRINADYTT